MSLDEMVRDLIDHYRDDEDHPAGPGLIARLDDLALRTSQPAASGGRSAPSSRPPGSLEALHWSTAIKAGARILDMQLRGSSKIQRWDRALKALPPGAENTGRVGEVTSTVGRWHSAARTVLGLQAPARDMRHAVCLVCGERSIKCRADGDRPRAWCSNPGCEDEDGRPARYDGDRLYLLTTNTGAEA